jgi:hypothetical protein
LRFSTIEGENEMKKILTTALFLGVLAAFKAQPAAAQVHVSISIGGFYDQLSSYGEWVDCGYGDCWVPYDVDASWQPYSNGEWIYTEYGWTWVSYDPWGEDPYHYGTWTYLDRYGWAWVPGTVWAPAWVTWSYSDNYVGWAPLPPNYSFGYSGYSGRPIVLSPTRYVFVPTNRFIGTNVRTVRIAPQQTTAIFRQTTPITRFGVTGGIVRNTALPIDRIQRATRSRIETRTIRTAPRPISGWTRDSRRQVSIVAPAQEVRQAIASRPQRAPRDGGRMNRRMDTRQQPQAVPQAQPGTVYRDRGQGQGHGQGRGRPQAREQAAPRVERQPVAPVQAQPEYRERGRGRPEARQQAAPPAPPQPQVAPPQAQPNPRSFENPGRGRGPENRGKPSKEQREGPGKGKAKGKDKDKPE